MQTVVFVAEAHDGIIEVPKDLHSVVTGKVEVSVTQAGQEIDITATELGIIGQLLDRPLPWNGSFLKREEIHG